MTVSVVIPTYNGAKTVVETIESVLDQSYSDIEVVISDDGSDDETLDLVRLVADDRLRIADDHAHVGPALNWDRALGNASCEYVKILAQDDVLYPDCIAVQVAAMRSLPEVSFCSVRRDVIGSDGSVLVSDRGLSGITGSVDIRTASRRIVRSGTNQFGEGAAVLARTGACRAVGSFDDSIPYVIDIDFWMRLLKHGPAVVVPETHAAFRVSASSWSNLLGPEQGRQFVRFANRLAEDPERGITATDLRVGAARALANGWMRQALYTRYRGRL